ncbi:MAG: HEAT repeat domain-containing protein [Candidatus Riflebacteria bacterium]|nr:HEAT repeat domain-containing protein [Candidatus Riflebacteria bacterium]
MKETETFWRNAKKSGRAVVLIVTVFFLFFLDSISEAGKKEKSKPKKPHHSHTEPKPAQSESTSNKPETPNKSVASTTEPASTKPKPELTTPASSTPVIPLSASSTSSPTIKEPILPLNNLSSSTTSAQITSQTITNPASPTVAPPKEQKTIPEASTTFTPISGKGQLEIISPNDAKISDLSEKLKKAELDRNLLNEAEILKKLISMEAATSEQKQRLASIEYQLKLSKDNLEKRWTEAEALYLKEEWGTLKVFLNQNPYFSEKDEYTLKFGEMSFACDYFLNNIPSEELNERARKLMLLNPKSFWAPMALALSALKCGNEKEAARQLDFAAHIDPKHPTVLLVSKTLKQKTNRRIMTAVILLLAITILGFLFSMFFGFLEKIEWIIVKFFIGRFPAKILPRLERKLGTHLEREERIELLQLLTETSFKAKTFQKGERYARSLLELIPKSRLALEFLGKFYLSLESFNALQAEIVASYCLIHPDREILKRFAGYVKETKNTRYSFDPVLTRYLSVFPEDTEIISLLKDAYLPRSPIEFNQETLNLLTKVWEISKDEKILQKVCRGYIAAGRFEDPFIKNVGEKISLRDLIFDVEKDLCPEEAKILETMESSKADKKIEEVRKLLERAYFSFENSEPIVSKLDEIIAEGKTPDRYWAEKSRNHVKETLIRCKRFKKSLGIEEDSIKSPSEHRAPSKTAAVPESAIPAQNVSDEIKKLSDSPNFETIQNLVKNSTEEEIPAWKEFLEKNLPASTISSVLKFIGRLKSKNLTPVLTKFLKHQNSRTRANAIEALEENDDSEAINAITIFLTDPDNRIRANAVKALHKWKVPQADRCLKMMTEDPQVPMRDSAIFVLKGIKLLWAQTLLKNMLNDPDPLIRKSAILALAEQSCKGGDEILKEYSKNPIPQDETEHIEKALKLFTENFVQKKA